MAENIVALNLGSQNITLGLFEVSKSKLLLKKYLIEEIIADPSNEALRNSQVKALLQRIVGEHGLKSAKVLYSVSGQSVFTRFIKLPALGDDNIEQLVAFEAQQHVPFPINEVAWDWELIESTGVEKEVAIVAIKKDLINEFDGVISSADLITTNAESSQIALTNSFYHSYPEESEPVMILDAGAKSTNIIFIQGKKVFIRSVNVSGVSVTSSISKEYQMPFEEAEKLKVDTGRMALNGAYLEQWDEATGAFASVISNALSRLPAEITRTINFFRSQHDGSPPAKVYLAGAASSLPYFKEFIEEKLSLPVEYLNPFNRVGVTSDVDTEILASQAHHLGELVGLATKGAENNVLGIDLVPDAISDRREESRKKPFYLSAAALLMFGSLAWAGMQLYNNVTSKSKVAELEGELTTLKPFEQKLTSLNKKKDKLDVISEDLSSVIEDRFRSIGHLDELRKHFTSEVVWLSSIEDLTAYSFGDKSAASSDKKTSNELVDIDFDSLGYGTSAIITTAGGEQEVNAIKVKGFWRDNPASQQAVFKILENIKNSPNSPFTFEIDGKNLDDNQVLQIQSSIPNEEYKASFTMILPLKSPALIAN